MQRIFFQRRLKRSDGLVDLFRFEIELAQAFVRLSRLRHDLIAVVRTLFHQRRRIVENSQHFAQTLLRLVQFAGFFLQLAEIVKDLRADLQTVLQSRTVGRAHEDGDSFFVLPQCPQLASIAIADFVIVGFQLQDAPTAGQRVVETIQGEVQWNQRRAMAAESGSSRRASSKVRVASSKRF